MKNFKVLNYEGITEGYLVKVEVDGEIKNVEIPVSNEDIKQYLENKYPEEMKGNEVVDIYSRHEDEVDEYFTNKYIEEL